jgi:hypothetical protein
VHGRDVQGLGSECIREMHSHGRASEGKVKKLAHGCVAQILGRNGILGLGDLLRSSPRDYPFVLRLGPGLGVQMMRDTAEGHKEDESRCDFQCARHHRRCTISP